jgi:hypothetical protein
MNYRCEEIASMCLFANEFCVNLPFVLKLITQDPKDKREIFCDDKLKAIMGGQPKITMFNMNKLLTPHLVEKVDRSQYVHEDNKKHKKDDDDEPESDEHEDAVVKEEDTEHGDEDEEGDDEKEKIKVKREEDEDEDDNERTAI